MSEHAYCYTCNRAQLVEVLPHRGGWRICAVCKNDELGETVVPALTGGRSPGLGHAPPVPPVRYEAAPTIVTTTETSRSEVGEYRPTPGPICAICGAVDAGEYLGRGADTCSVYLCDTCAVDRRVVKKETWSMERGHVISVSRDEQAPTPRTYASIAADVAAIVERKNKAYGDSFAKVTRVLELMFPNGVPVEAYADLGGIVRTLDKLFRVATDRDALEENPWGDIAGYALLAIRRVEADKGRA